MLLKNSVKRSVQLAFSVLAAAALLFFHTTKSSAAPESKLQKYSKTPSGIVCLTIDDGFSRDDLILNLTVLRQYKVRCTLFVIGCMLTKYPDLWQQAIRDGHEICYHTMYHHEISAWGNKRIVADLNRWVDTAHKVLGNEYVVPKFVRFPGGRGSGSRRILKLFDDLGYKVIYWDIDTYSQAHIKHISIENFIKASTKSGSIILTHFRKFDSTALPNYISWLVQNFRLGTLTEAFSDTAPATDPPVEHLPQTTIPGGLPFVPARFPVDLFLDSFLRYKA